MEYYNDISNSEMRVSNLDAILISLKNILTTYKSSILFNREFGFNLEELLFLPNSKVSENYIKTELEREIKKYMDIDQITINYNFSYNILDRKFSIVMDVSEVADSNNTRVLVL